MQVVLCCVAAYRAPRFKLKVAGGGGGGGGGGPRAPYLEHMGEANQQQSYRISDGLREVYYIIVESSPTS